MRARSYDLALNKRWSKFGALTAFVVLTMPPGVRERWRDNTVYGGDDEGMAAALDAEREHAGVTCIVFARRACW